MTFFFYTTHIYGHIFVVGVRQTQNISLGVRCTATYPLHYTEYL